MASILDILKERQQSQSLGSPANRSLRSGIVSGTDGVRYQVNDGFNTINCFSLIETHLRAGDRVWIGEGAAGTNLILGFAGADLNFSG
jgi:hypothetical protein